jgi:hypothetical protein
LLGFQSGLLAILILQPWTQEVFDPVITIPIRPVFRWIANLIDLEVLHLAILGETRYKSFHINLGQRQFHLAENKGEPAQKIAGSIGLIVPNLETLRE